MKILVKTIAGSHLFGTNTASSDHDYKGVFLPEAKDILLGKFDQTVHQNTNTSNTKNTKDDVDIEFYSLDKFLKMLHQGQTVAWEILFTPDNMILEKHPIWDEVRSNPEKFLSKKVDAYIGYAKQQANRYGIRGSRMQTVKDILQYLKCFPNWVELGQCDLTEILKHEHVEKLDKTFMGRGVELISICGKKFQPNTQLAYVIQPLQKLYDEYGERSRQAMKNEGVDWKALSHSVRVCMQARNLLKYGKLVLPLPSDQLELIMKIKRGELDFSIVSNLIDENMTSLLIEREESSFPDSPNLKVFQDLQTSIYSRVVKGEI